MSVAANLIPESSILKQNWYFSYEIYSREITTADYGVSHLLLLFKNVIVSCLEFWEMVKPVTLKMTRR